MWNTGSNLTFSTAFRLPLHLTARRSSPVSLRLTPSPRGRVYYTVIPSRCAHRRGALSTKCEEVLLGRNPLSIPETPGDCHTSDIGHWFAMTDGRGYADRQYPSAKAVNIDTFKKYAIMTESCNMELYVDFTDISSDRYKECCYDQSLFY